MSFILDQNISYRVIGLISKYFTNVKHVRQLGLVDASDEEIWLYAKLNECTIITFDSDFIDFAILRNAPPQIIWLRFGNASNNKIADKLIANSSVINDFLVDKSHGISFLEIN